MILTDINIFQWSIAVVCAVLIGMSKTGIAGIGMLVVPLLALTFGGIESTGILLPMLIMADVFGVSYYHRSAKWNHIIKLLPSALAGIVIGLLIGRGISPELFKRFIAVCVLVSLGIMLWQDIKKREAEKERSWWFTALFGLTGGFTTMIGNAAGPVMSVYLLAAKLPKKEYIGTGAWFFMTINLVKFPLQLWVWHNITLQTIVFNCILLPAIALGAWFGIKLAGMLSDKHYKVFVLAVTFISAIVLFV